MLTDRQRHNWHAAENALQALIRLNRVNTASVCDGTPFLKVEEKRNIENQIQWLEAICKELEGGVRSKDSDSIRLIVDGAEDTHPQAFSKPLPATHCKLCNVVLTAKTLCKADFGENYYCPDCDQELRHNA